MDTGDCGDFVCHSQFSSDDSSPPEKQLHELYPYGVEGGPFFHPVERRFLSMKNFFVRVNELLGFLEGFRGSRSGNMR